MYYTIDGDFVNKNENKLVEGFDEELVLKSIDNSEYIKEFLPGPFGGIDTTQSMDDAMLFKQYTYSMNGISVSILEDLNSSILIVKDSKLNVYKDDKYPLMSESEKINFLIKLKRQDVQLVNPKIITTTGVKGYMATTFNSLTPPPILSDELVNKCPNNHICIPATEWESLNLKDALMYQLPGISYGEMDSMES